MRKHIVEPRLLGEINVKVNGIVIPGSACEQSEGRSSYGSYQMRRQPITDRELLNVFSHVVPPELF